MFQSENRHFSKRNYTKDYSVFQLPHIKQLHNQDLSFLYTLPHLFSLHPDVFAHHKYVAQKFAKPEKGLLHTRRNLVQSTPSARLDLSDFLQSATDDFLRYRLNSCLYDNNPFPSSLNKEPCLQMHPLFFFL